MRRLEKLESTVFHERDVAAHELELEHVTVVCGAEQHRLAAQLNAPLARLEHAIDDVLRLGLIVEHRDVMRLRATGPAGLELLAELARARGHQRVRCVEDRLCRPVIAFQRHDARGRCVLLREVEDVVHGRGPERIDRLGVVADDGHARATRLERQQHLRLQPIRVLVLVDQHVIEATRRSLPRASGSCIMTCQ